LVALVSDILDIARYDSGKVELQETDFVLNELLTDECRQLQPLAEEKGLQLIMELPDRPICLHADRVKLGRILGNLVANALKFTDKGSVRVSAALDTERRVLLRVADTGIGIAPEDQARIFDEFAQVHNPARDRTRGSGLGLAICKRLVEVMGGTLTLASDVQQGSTFTVTLPASSVLLRLDAALAPGAPPRRSLFSSSGGDLLSGIRILLVEDHTATRESAVQILRGEGATVLEAADGRSALQMLEQGGVDILLLDMMLPDMDGREVLKVLQVHRPDGLKGVLILTGDLTSERLEEVKRLGADALIGKPIDLDQLVATLRVLQHGA
jgi:CheY-like chemotaxis protein/anti-sigma regulatory factor (Ser/Thr protein kinase)